MKLIKFAALAIMAFGLFSCQPQKRVIYMQDAQNNQSIKVPEVAQIRIKPLDRITIVVSSKDPELAAPFNAASSYNSLSMNPLGNSTANGQQSIQVRTIDPEGNLDLPIIGKIHCAGKTRNELAEHIAKAIIDGGYISDPSVNIQFADMKVYVMGEVARPGQYDVVRDQVTVLEALTMAGDMTIYGNRSNIQIIRKEGGENKFYIINLLNSDFISSPAYYLQQGDVVYVQPNRQRTAVAEINQNRTFWISVSSILISTATLVCTIINITK